MEHPQNESPNSSKTPVFCSIDGLACSPINLSQLNRKLESYPNRTAAENLGKGFTMGFSIGFQGTPSPNFAKNHGSASRGLHIVQALLMEEVRLGRVAGPYDEPPLANLKVSPLGLVEKSTKGKFRLIFDLSYPAGNAVNDGIPQECRSVQYTHFDAITNMIRKLGMGSFLVKVDIRAAFRLLPVHPSEFYLLGMQLEGKFFVDKAIPFGCAASCSLFETFSTFLEWCIKQETGHEWIIHYLDDFCGAGQSRSAAYDTKEAILRTFQELGVPIAEEKIEGPDTRIKYLGLIVDTVSMSVTLPEDKLSDLKSAITSCLGRSKITLRELQSLIGKLSFACRAVVPGRAFLRRLIDATIGVKMPHHRIRVNKSMKSDLLVWEEFLSNFHGSSIILADEWWKECDLQLFTDASGSVGFGAFCQGHWVSESWPSVMMDYDITYKELFPITLSLELWGELLRDKRVLLMCDNQAVVASINSKTSRSKTVMSLLRRLVLSALKLNIHIKARHLAGTKNSLADALSRGQFHRFRALAPHADMSPTVIPAHLWRLPDEK